MNNTGPNKKILRKFGFKSDQEGIINRYLRESTGWEQHLKRTKDFIIKAAQNKNKKSAIVLGSGWLLDVPLEELASTFEKLILVDIVHPRQIEHKIKKFENVELLQADITGLVQVYYDALKLIKKNENKPRLNQLKPNYGEQLLKEIEKADFVVSLNILNQLDILICDYIKKFELYTEQEINDVRKYIQSNHLSLLQKNKSALITDYEELNKDDNGHLIKSKKLIHVEIPQNKNAVRWDWEFDMKRTYHTDSTTIFKVMAVNC